MKLFRLFVLAFAAIQISSAQAPQAAPAQQCRPRPRRNARLHSRRVGHAHALHDRVPLAG